jgi:hypothetical protein
MSVRRATNDFRNAIIVKIDQRQNQLAVVHLIRKTNGIEPFRRFLNSYRAHSSGIDHDLVLLFKGFGSKSQMETHLELAADLLPTVTLVDDLGFDLGAYIATAQSLVHRRLCFLNSFSMILADGWLHKLTSALDQTHIGLVGASGSWASQRTYVRFDLGLGGAYTDFLPPRAVTRKRLSELERTSRALGARDAGLAHKLSSARDAVRRYATMEPFPAHHVRTNAFAVDREMLLRVKMGKQRDKMDAYILESGRRSMTRQIEAMGLRAVVVGRDGCHYEHERWPESFTFWQCNQENLLVADNQTETYRNGDRELRTILSSFAWGPMADPAAMSASGHV